MGASTQDHCPFCGTKDVAFTAVHEWNSTNGQRALFKCGHCKEAVIREVLGNRNVSLVAISGTLNFHNVLLGDQWPMPISSDAPADCPENVSRYYKQAIDSLNSGNFDASGMMFRKSLEAATKNKAPDLVNKPLVKRIDALVDAGMLTQDMGIWAHEIRLGGNEAAHEDEPFTGEEARSLHDFTENFLRYSFTLPAAVTRRSAPSS